MELVMQIDIADDEVRGLTTCAGASGRYANLAPATDTAAAATNAKMQLQIQR
jgi:hypothetical protein